MNIPSRIGLVYELRPGVLQETQRLLHARSRSRSEAYTVWVGELEAKRAVVWEAWPVEAEADSWHAMISFDEVLKLGARVAMRNWFIVAQLHTHRGGAFHSPTDDAYPISSQVGFLSIVVPNFGGDPPGVGWAYYEHEGAGRWRPIPEQEVRNRIVTERGWWTKLLNGIKERVSSSKL
jgi:hypothetical protein